MAPPVVRNGVGTVATPRPPRWPLRIAAEPPPRRAPRASRSDRRASRCPPLTRARGPPRLRRGGPSVWGSGGHLGAPSLNDRGDRARPLVAPARQAGRPAPGPAAGAHDEDVVGALEEPPPRRRVGGLGGTRQPGGPLEGGGGAARVVDQEGLDPAGGPHPLARELPAV